MKRHLLIRSLTLSLALATTAWTLRPLPALAQHPAPAGLGGGEPPTRAAGAAPAGTPAPATATARPTPPAVIVAPRPGAATPAVGAGAAPVLPLFPSVPATPVPPAPVVAPPPKMVLPEAFPGTPGAPLPPRATGGSGIGSGFGAGGMAPPAGGPPAVVPGDPFVAIGAGRAAAPAVAPQGPPPVSLRLVVQTFDLSRPDLMELLQFKGDDTQRYQQVIEWSKTGRTSLKTVQAMTMSNGYRSSSNSIHEIRYPTEFIHPLTKDDFLSPTAYEIRNAGEEIEVEPTMEESGQGILNFALKNVLFAGFSDIYGTPGKKSSGAASPMFRSRKITSSIVFGEPKQQWIGSVSSPAENDGTLDAQSRVAFVRITPEDFSKLPPIQVQSPQQVRTDFSFFSLDRTTARDLLLTNQSPQDWYDTMNAMVKAGKAKLEHVATNVTPLYHRSAVEEIAEVRFGSGFSGHMLAEEANPATATPPLSNPPPAAAASETDPSLPSTVRPASGDKKRTVLPNVPARFETRTVGFVAELEHGLRPDAPVLDLNLSVRFVRHLGDIPATGLAKDYPPQPLFETREFTGQCCVIPGQQQLIGTFNLPSASGATGDKDDQRVILGFVRATMNP